VRPSYLLSVGFIHAKLKTSILCLARTGHYVVGEVLFFAIFLAHGTF
jgi:hypothetical protein